MFVPRKKSEMDDFCNQMIDQCMYSRKARTELAIRNERLYRTGTTGGAHAKQNKCYTQIDMYSSLLYSPSTVRFGIDFEEDDNEAWTSRIRTAAKHLNRKFRRRNLHLQISTAVEWSCVYGAMFVKVTNAQDGYVGHLIKPQDIGVWNESVNDLTDQECFVHAMRVSKASVRRLLYAHPDKDKLMERIKSAVPEDRRDSSLSSYDLITNGVGQLQTSGSATPGAGNALLTGFDQGPRPVISPDTESELVDMYEIWVQDDARQDWTTLRYVQPGILLEGAIQHRNLCDAPGMQPVVKISHKEVPGYFWGESRLEQIKELQELKNKRFNQIDKIYERQIDPPRVFRGFSSVTDEKLLALLAPGGSMVDESPTGDIKELKPSLPDGALEYLNMIDKYFDEAGGFNAMLMGEGDQGVRAGNHAQSLMRASGTRVRDAAVLVESQIAEIGELCLSISQAKDAKVYRDDKGQEFVLDQLPDDAYVVVDSHSSSPIFAHDNETLAFALAKSGAIDGADLLEMTRPPNTENLITKLHRREEQKAQFIQQHPEILQKGKPGPKT